MLLAVTAAMHAFSNYGALHVDAVDAAMSAAVKIVKTLKKQSICNSCKTNDIAFRC
jgi:hypothetical protein